MTGFYNITTAIKNQLLQDKFCKSVTIGDIFEVDLAKQTIFPLSHIIVNNAVLENNIWRFNMTVIAMDIVDKTKDLTTDKFRGNDNEHDVLNTQLAVLNRLFEILRRGSLYEEHYQLDGNPNLEPFTERFENYLAGWAGTFDVLIPNDMTACDGFETPTVTCDGTTLTIKDSSGATLYTVNLASGQTSNQTIADSTYLVEYENGTPIESGSILAEGSAVIQVPNPTTCADAVVNVNSVFFDNVASGGTLNIEVLKSTGNDLVGSKQGQYWRIGDSTAVLKTSGGATISTTPIKAEESEDITAPDATVENSNASYTDSVVSGGTLVLPDITVTDSDGSTYSQPSVENVVCTLSPDTDLEVNGTPEGTFAAGSTIEVNITDGVNPVTPDNVTVVGDVVTIEVPAATPAPVGATLMKTGQTTSYRTGDDGDLEAGRATDFLTLASNNPFGSTARFTDELGGSTYTNNIVIDWSTYNGATVLGWDRRKNGGGANVDVQWDAAIDAALIHSVATFTSGWRLPNILELISIRDYSTTWFWNSAPFNWGTANGIVWSATTNATNTTQAFAGQFNNATFSNTSKTAAFQPRWVACRIFTVTGTTLT
jgi:hypothetical protein